MFFNQAGGLYSNSSTICQTNEISENTSLSINSVSPSNESNKQPNWRKPDRVAWMSSRRFTRSQPTDAQTENLDVSLIEDQKLRELSETISDLIVRTKN